MVFTRVVQRNVSLGSALLDKFCNSALQQHVELSRSLYNKVMYIIQYEIFIIPLF